MEKPTEQLPANAPILAVDLGQKRVGIAVSDELSISITRLDPLRRSNWKQLVRDVDRLVSRFDAKVVVIGLPLRLNGTPGEAADKARQAAIKLARSLKVPVYLQDERLSSVEAEHQLRAEGYRRDQIPTRIDSEAAAVILRDFIESDQEKIRIYP